MSKKPNGKQEVAARSEQSPAEQGPPRCLAIAGSGIRTANQFAEFMSGLISDLIESKISPQVGNAAVNAGGKLLKAVEMQMKYGKPSQSDGSGKTLELVSAEK